MNCKICGTKSKELFKTKILNKHKVSYYQCPKCLFIQTEKEYWLKEAYESPMNLTDTGVLTRNILLGLRTALIIEFLLKKKGKYLDYAGGYGILTRFLRDLGFDFYWNDPYTKNELARGFESDLKEKYDAVTIFECFEHYVNPVEETKSIFKVSDTIILSTTLVPKPTPKAKVWWYYGIEHGQHIALYSKETFKEIADQLDCYYYTDNRYFHILTKKKISGFLFRVLSSNIGLLLIPIIIIRNRSKTVPDSKMLKRRLSSKSS